MDPVTEAALEAVAVEQRQEELEILLLAIVGGGGHQEEMAGQRAEEPGELVALGVPDLAAEEGRRELVGLVADHQIPAGVGGLELLLDRIVAGELVEVGNDQAVLEEPVAGAGRLELVVGEDLEGQMEAAIELILPLLGEAPGADDSGSAGDRRGR